MAAQASVEVGVAHAEADGCWFAAVVAAGELHDDLGLGARVWLAWAQREVDAHGACAARSGEAGYVEQRVRLTGEAFAVGRDDLSLLLRALCE